MNKVAVITGGSSGIGLHTAQALVACGYTVYELSRRAFAPEAYTHICADVTQEAQMHAALSSIYEKEGRIDLLINNAGFGISGALEFTQNEDAKRLLDVNLFGMVNTCKAVLPMMRRQGFGKIINISSVAGSISIPFQAWYSISKASAISFTMALANEVTPFGIAACAVLPGDIRTGFTAAREKNPAGDDIYGGRIARSVAVMEHDETNGMDPQTAAHAICKIAKKRKVKPLYAIGVKYSLFVWLSRILPCAAVNRIVRILYAK